MVKTAISAFCSLQLAFFLVFFISCAVLSTLVQTLLLIFSIFSLKHPAKYIGKKPRKYTIPAKPLGPQGSGSGVHQASDQVRVYRDSSANTNGGGLHLQKYQRVRLGCVMSSQFSIQSKFEICRFRF